MVLLDHPNCWTSTGRLISSVIINWSICQFNFKGTSAQEEQKTILHWLLIYIDMVKLTLHGFEPARKKCESVKV